MPALLQNNSRMKPNTNNKSAVAAELLALAEKFKRIGSLTQAKFLTELASNDPENRGSIVLEGWKALYQYMSKS